MIDYKKISHITCLNHNAKGGAITQLGGRTNEVVVNLSDEDSYMEIEGDKISPKQVRKYMWDNRKRRSFKRESAVVWTFFNSEENVSVIAVGAYTSKPAATRCRKDIIYGS